MTDKSPAGDEQICPVCHAKMTRVFVEWYCPREDEHARIIEQAKKSRIILEEDTKESWIKPGALFALTEEGAIEMNRVYPTPIIQWAAGDLGRIEEVEPTNTMFRYSMDAPASRSAVYRALVVEADTYFHHIDPA